MDQIQKDYIVFSQRMAGYMMLKGCRLLKIGQDKNVITKNVYYFPDTHYVKEYANEYIEQSKKTI